MADLIERAVKLTWLDTDAGHLILMPAHSRSQWSGIKAPEDGRVVQARSRWNDAGDLATDYDRACDINDYVGIIDVGSGRGIVLGREPLPATWVPTRQGGILVARLYTSEVGTPAEIPTVPQDLAWVPVGRVDYGESELVLFDSTEPGFEKPCFPSLPVTIVPGAYIVEHTKLVNDDMELWLVRLRPTDRSA